MGPVSHVFCATAQGRLAKLMSRKTHVSTPIYFLVLFSVEFFGEDHAAGGALDETDDFDV